MFDCQLSLCTEYWEKNQEQKYSLLETKEGSRLRDRTGNIGKANKSLPCRRIWDKREAKQENGPQIKCCKVKWPEG